MKRLFYVAQDMTYAVNECLLLYMIRYPADSFRGFLDNFRIFLY